MGVVSQIVFGILAASLFEWFFHKFILHHLGKHKGSIWSFHWSSHHKIARRNYLIDPDYFLPLHKQIFSKEGFSLFLGILLVSPLIVILPAMTVAMWFYIVLYFIVHRQCHRDARWAMKYLPAHVDHHLGKSQDKNWGVVTSFWDHIFRTRVRMPR